MGGQGQGKLFIGSLLSIFICTECATGRKAGHCSHVRVSSNSPPTSIAQYVFNVKHPLFSGFLYQLRYTVFRKNFHGTEFFSSLPEQKFPVQAAPFNEH